MSLKLFLKIFHKDYNFTTTFKNIALGSLPIMLHSDICVLNNQGSEVLKNLGECIYDSGGYFIIDGKEKVIIAQERITTNRLFTSKIKDDEVFSHKGLIKCTADVGETVLSPKSIEFYLVKNDTDSKQYLTKRGAILCSFKGINNNKIPLFVLFRALNIEADQEILDLFLLGDGRQIDCHDNYPPFRIFSESVLWNPTFHGSAA